MDTKLVSLSGTDKNPNSVKDKLTSTLMGYVQKYAVYDLPDSENDDKKTSEENINHLKNTCEGVGAAILRAVAVESAKFKNL
ncbi:MAG: hypothetical protein MUC49_02040 [Raineya sp.]|jgi:hypothetical protein|nr:hypothetical protein [Raineya sp.]